MVVTSIKCDIVVSVPIRGSINLTIWSVLTYHRKQLKHVSVPIRGSINLTSYALDIGVVKAYINRFRPHQGINKFNPVSETVGIYWF